MLRVKRSHKPQSAYDIVSIHVLMIYTNIGTSGIPDLGNYFVPASKRAGANLFGFDAPERTEVVSLMKKLQDSSKECAMMNSKEHIWAVVEGKRQQAE